MACSCCSTFAALLLRSRARAVDSERKSGRVPAKRRWGRKIVNRHAPINVGPVLATSCRRHSPIKKAKPPSLQRLQATGGLAWAELVWHKMRYERTNKSPTDKSGNQM